MRRCIALKALRSKQSAFEIRDALNIDQPVPSPQGATGSTRDAIPTAFLYVLCS